MKVRAKQKYSRQSPRKVRMVANQVKDLSLQEALEQLALINKKASIVLLKVFRQAIANATNNHGLQIDQLEIDKVLVETGPTYKRFRAVSRGRAHKILKRTCHVEVVLQTKEKKNKQTEKTAKSKTKSKKSKDKSDKKTKSKKAKKQDKKNSKKSKSEKEDNKKSTNNK